MKRTQNTLVYFIAPLLVLIFSLDAAAQHSSQTPPPPTEAEKATEAADRAKFDKELEDLVNNLSDEEIEKYKKTKKDSVTKKPTVLPLPVNKKGSKASPGSAYTKRTRENTPKTDPQE